MKVDTVGSVDWAVGAIRWFPAALDYWYYSGHVHAYYQSYSAVFTIEPVDMIGGELPRKERRLVEAWAEMHSGEMIENWNRLHDGRLPFKVASLR